MTAVSGSIFQTHPESVATLVGDIETGRVVLPEFQRDFRWETDRTARLLSSIIARFPTGALLLWAQATPADGKDPAVGKRPIEGAPGVGMPTFRFILDGQQRLTALYRALYGVSEEERYFVDLKALLDPTTLRPVPEAEIDWDAVIVDKELTAREKRTLVKDRQAAKDAGDDPDTVLAEHDTAQYQAEAWLFPVHRLRDGAFHDWLDEVVDKMPTGTDKNATRKAFRSVHDTHLKYLLDYDYPVVTLDQDTELVAVCRIFETLNKSAVTLGPFELLTAKFFPKDVNLRETWDTAKTEFPVLEEFGVDPYAVLQAVTLRAHGSAQRFAVLNKLTAQDVDTHWRSTVEGIRRSAELLQNDCGVMSSAWLPYQMLLVPLGAAWNEIDKLAGPARIEGKAKLKRYFWCTAFTGNFDQGANSQAQADYQALKKWIAGDDTAAPEALTAKLPIRGEVIESATTRKTAYFKALIALLVKAGARDFHEGESMTPARVREHAIEAHHVFPKKWLSTQGLSESADLILNQAPINKSTNASIGSKAPSKYLGKLKDEVKNRDLEPVLKSHFINRRDLQDDAYSRFLDRRYKAIVQELNKVIRPKKVVEGP